MAREAKFILAIGKKGVGKTFKTLQEITYFMKATGRQVLFIDANDEYGNVRSDHKDASFPDIQALALEDVPKWVLSKRCEARRILPYDKTGKPYNNNEMQAVMKQVLKTFKNGCLVIEDMTKYVSDSTPADLIGSIIAQRHSSVDIYIHFQSIGKAAHPKLYANCTIIRLHNVEDNVERHAPKFPETTTLFLAENIMKIKCKTNVRFCCYVWKEDKKIKGAFTKKEFEEAIVAYIQDNPKIYRKELNRVDIFTGKKIHKDSATCAKYLISQYMEYYGNPV
jgi:hypothetical protein